MSVEVVLRVCGGGLCADAIRCCGVLEVRFPWWETALSALFHCTGCYATRCGSPSKEEGKEVSWVVMNVVLKLKNTVIVSYCPPVFFLSATHPSSRNTTSVTLRTAEVADLLRMQWRTQETDNLPTSKDTWLSMHHATGRVLYNKSEWLYRLLQLFFCCDCVLWERLV